MSIKTIAILGAGNGGCAAAADLKIRGYNVRLFSRSEATVAPVVEHGGIELIEAASQKFATPDLVTTNLAEAVRGAELIVTAAPAVAHEFLARELAPEVRPGQRILLNPGHTGGSLHFMNVLRRNGVNDQVAVCETVTLTYICRMPAPARVEVYRRTTNLRCAAFPGKNGSEIVKEIAAVFPNVVPAENVLETGFSNINAIMHPAGMVGNAGWIEHTGGDFRYYSEGITPAIAAWIDRVDRERLEIVTKLGLKPVPFIEIFHQAGLTTAAALESGSFYRAIRESEPNRTIKAPSSLDHRYIREDVGYGLVPMAAIGRLLGVGTPVIDALITLASASSGTDYTREGLSLEKMGLAGISAGELPKILQDGFPQA